LKNFKLTKSKSSGVKPEAEICGALLMRHEHVRRLVSRVISSLKKIMLAETKFSSEKPEMDILGALLMRHQDW
jgi:hypothetical protein